MRMSALEVARLVDGTVEGGASVVITGAEVDSRRIRSGDLFVALRGERSDGHRFVAKAIGSGAVRPRWDASLAASERHSHTPGISER